ncbi:MAG: hypothetical protein WCF23_08155 [Candidatus Nitrosopolaris sp.]
MVRIPTKVTNERREKVWFLMLKGHNAPSISKTLHSPTITIYKDIKFLTKKSKQYVYHMAKGTHVLMYRRAIEGIALALSEAWNKFNDPSIPEKQKLGYLRLTKERNEKIYEFTANGPTEMAVMDLMRRIERMGLDINTPLILSEQEQIRNYINKNPRLAEPSSYSGDNKSNESNELSS